MVDSNYQPALKIKQKFFGGNLPDAGAFAAGANAVGAAYL
jgi:hypothetical protein